MLELFNQVYALIKKDVLLMKRTKKFLMAELAEPLISLMYLSSSSTDQNRKSKLTISPITIALFLRGIISSTVLKIMFEKERNYKEYLRVNGASIYSYMLSQFLLYFIRASVIVLLMFAGFIYIMGIQNIFDPVFTLVSFFVYTVAFLNLALMTTTLFSSSRFVADAMSISLFVFTFVYSRVAESHDQWVYYLSCLFPPMACIFTAPFLTGQLQNKANFMPQQALSMQNFQLLLLLYSLWNL